MTEQILKCKLLGEQLGYLTSSSMPEHFLEGLTISNDLVIEGSRNAVEGLRERLTELLAKVGFDEDYMPTPEGEMIEQIIDALHVP